MALINIIVDTEKCTIKSDINGKNIPDILEVRCFMYTPWDAKDEEEEQEVRVEIISGTKDEETGVNRTIITTCAGEQIEQKDEIVSSLAKALFPNKYK